MRTAFGVLGLVSIAAGLALSALDWPLVASCLTIGALIVGFNVWIRRIASEE
jgi:hypothetical protein